MFVSVQVSPDKKIFSSYSIRFSFTEGWFSYNNKGSLSGLARLNNKELVRMISADSTETGRKYGLLYEISSEQSLLESVIVENFS